MVLTWYENSDETDSDDSDSSEDSIDQEIAAEATSQQRISTPNPFDGLNEADIPTITPIPTQKPPMHKQQSDYGFKDASTVMNAQGLGKYNAGD